MYDQTKFRSLESLDDGYDEEDGQSMMMLNTKATTAGTQTECWEHQHSSNQPSSDDLLSHISEALFEDGDDRDNEFRKHLHTTTTQVSFTGKPYAIIDDDDYTKATQISPDALRLVENHSDAHKDKPTLGLIYYVIHTILMTGNMYAQQ